MNFVDVGIHIHTPKYLPRPTCTHHSSCNDEYKPSHTLQNFEDDVIERRKPGKNEKLYAYIFYTGVLVTMYVCICYLLHDVSGYDITSG